MGDKVLILGGTEDSLRLHSLLVRQGLAVILSFAGRTKLPASLPHEYRIGGFGGVSGLADFLRENDIAAVVDATHPFAAQISRNCLEAATTTGTPILRFTRPPWPKSEGDNWQEVGDETEAAASLPAGARVFLALGAQKLGAFAKRSDVGFVVRVVDPPVSPLLPFAHEVVTDRGPYDIECERELLLRHDISHIVARNSGGIGAAAKISAARDLRIPVLMIARPEISTDGSAAPTVETAKDACAWIIDRLG